MEENKSYIIRDFRQEDFPALISLWEKMDMTSAARADDLPSISRTLNMGGKLFLIFRSDNNSLAGSSWITFDGRRLYLHHFAIEPCLQYKGLGRKLLDHSLRWAASTGIQIKLEVHRDNARALDLYKKNGFGWLGDYVVYIIRDYSKL